MTKLAETWFTAFGIAFVCSILLIGFVIGFLLRWLTKFSDRQIMVVSGVLPIFLFFTVVFLTSFGHGALGVTDYLNWRALFEFVVMFCFSFLGAGVGIRAYQVLSKFLLMKRSKEGK